MPTVYSHAYDIYGDVIVCTTARVWLVVKTDYRL